MELVRKSTTNVYDVQAVSGGYNLNANISIRNNTISSISGGVYKDNLFVSWNAYKQPGDGEMKFNIGDVPVSESTAISSLVSEMINSIITEFES